MADESTWPRFAQPSEVTFGVYTNGRELVFRGGEWDPSEYVHDGDWWLSLDDLPAPPEEP
jgi:hypothetical protein